ncbi:DUF3793 family protein [Oceanirhabdus sp. W0125-5]|uniref:DUF3793 family protein n=1 Tax=Oceanirhabdus sp. W0125-5 TaxID=2999116 RepID=UPI0022F2C39D|nr:DUF3793 family protein [Oceanirhabdus sp. W0125-5]WBW98748.1 DUF3793 family protein [Oceanirhabdus sp. W0125-5]
MNREILNKYLEFLNNSNVYDAFEAYIFFNIAPVVDGVKPASLVRITNRMNFLTLWDDIKEKIKIHGIEHLELKTHCGNSVVIFYNKEMLNEYVNRKDIREFLDNNGYAECSTIDTMLENLKNKFHNTCPHEIGIFLGYPLEDTKEFIKNEGQNCLLCGYWKVYNDEESARCIFQKYDNAKRKILNLIVNKNVRNLYCI